MPNRPEIVEIPVTSLSPPPPGRSLSAIQDVFAGGGEMGALMRAFDWAKTPLGPVETWSPTLRSTTRLLLSNCSGMLLWWGPDFIQIYNDAYIPVLGNKHPHVALGRPFAECWSEVFYLLGPLVRTALEGGPPTWMDDIPLEVDRFGFLEETHFTIGYSPVPDETAPGGIGGVLATVHEITEKVLAERRVRVLRDLGATGPAEARTAEEACAAAAATLGIHGKDIPFALLYLTESNGRFARLAAYTGIGDCAALSPDLVEIDLPGIDLPEIDLPEIDKAETAHQAASAWPFAACRELQEIIVVDDLRRRFDRLPVGPWFDPPHMAAVVPIRSNIAHQLAGFLVAGISPRLRFGDTYRGFLELASAQIATAIANARAYEEERRRNDALAETEQRIRESEERFRAFVEASSDAVYRMNADWSEMRQLRGRDFVADIEAPSGSWLEKYIHPEDRQLVLDAIQKAIHEKSVFELEHRVLRLDGTPGWTFSRAVPLFDASGEIVEWFGAATDITARKQSEQALLRSEKLATLGRMAATIAHEINNPLEAVTNLLFLADEEENLPPTAHHYLQMAEVELRRVAHITRQSLGFYRESNAPALTSVNAVLDSAVELLKSKIDEKRAKVEKEWRADVRIFAVAGELRQVFSNLLSNSLDAIGFNGKIRIRISTHAAARDAAARSVRITFLDDGRGISPAARSHLFEPFFTTKGTVGTGLGLWVTRQIVEKHSGTIRLQSRSQGARTGTAFSIVLPFKTEASGHYNSF
jgi:signal transduction histidine kinase